MKDLVEVIAKALVDHPDEVSVSEKENGRSLTVELHVAPSDMGKVIGKQGRIAKAIRTVVKAAAMEDNKNTEIVCGPLTMNEASFEAKVDGEPLSLSAKEFKLLLVFAKNPERVYSREMLLSLVWDNAYVDERTVDVHMLRLRKQLQGTRAENLLQTVRGLGYRAHISE